MSKPNNSKFNIILPIVISVSLVTGILIAEVLNKSNTSQSILIPQNKDKLNMVVDYVANEYVDEVSRDELAEIAIPKFLETLDPHTVYFTSDEAKAVEEELKGQFDGIGVQFNIYRDTVLVVNVIKGGPSEKYGLKDGDRIVAVNDSVIAGIGINNEEVMGHLKGIGGTKVELDVYRRGEEDLIPIAIVRGSIPLRSVDAFYMVNSNTGYIKISSFSSNTHNQFVDAVFKLRKKGVETIIVDLRNNSGGYLTSATDIIDEFLESGEQIVYTEGNARPKSTTSSTKKRSVCLDLGIIVLIDEFSASASEILAGAIQDNDRGFVIGRRSYGKGLVQESTTFDDGSIIRLTIARYYTPSGRCIQKSYENGMDEYYADIYNRYTHGEFLEQDSISLNDSLIYRTKMGRPVFGGGGIMPDVFVPIDTAGYTDLYGAINRKNLAYYFSIDYIDSNREQLREIDNLDDLKVFLSDNGAVQKFWSFVTTRGVVVNAQERAISGLYIDNNVIAYIARQVLGDNEFYEVANRFDPVMDSALNIIDSKRELE